MQLTGAEIIIECLKEQGVDTIFGYPGGAVLNIYDALYHHRDEIKHYLTAHEQGAAHAADGYARATGKVGVCLATSGPGATNLVTGIATAYMDSVPMVAITGNVAVPLLGKDSFQEVDIAGITMPITKHNFIVKDVNSLADIIRKAFYIAKEGRPGPVLVDIPKDITATLAEYEPKQPIPCSRNTKDFHDEEIVEVVSLINKAEKPFIYAGGGIIISEAAEELLTFVETIDAPISVSSMGLGGFPSSNRHFTGMIGMHGTKTSNILASTCDLLIVVGARFSDRVATNVQKFAPNAKIVHIDIDAAEINKNIRVHCSIIGDLKEVLQRINTKLDKHVRTEWMAVAEEMKASGTKPTQDRTVLRPRHIMDKISEYVKQDALVVTEVGQHQMWACQYIQFEKPRTLLTSGGLGTMGYGLGAAIGASIGCPGRIVFNIAGDGCFRMNNIELATAVEYEVPLIVILVNNHSLGMVRQWQSLFYDSRFSSTNLGDKMTDFVKLAEAYQAVAFHVTTVDEFERAVDEAVALKRTVVINCEIDRDEKVLPIIPPGASIDEVVTE